MSFVWAPAKEPCQGAGAFGANGLATPERRARLEALTRGGGARPDVVLFNSGLHDANVRNRWTPKFSREQGAVRTSVPRRASRAPVRAYPRRQYVGHLADAWKVLKSVAPNATMIWRTTSPQFHTFECELGHGNPGVKIMNHAARRAVPPGAKVLDAWALRYGRPNGGDGHHCRSDASCVAQLRVLYALLKE